MTDLDAALADWQEAKTQLDILTKREKEAREYVFALAFPRSHRGTNKLSLKDNVDLVATIRYNYKIEAVPQPKAHGYAASAIFDRVCEYKPKVKESKWNELTAEELQIVAEFITVTPGLPTLTLKPAKKD